MLNGLGHKTGCCGTPEFGDGCGEIHPDIITIAGGELVTADPEVAMTALQYADIGVIGEGEETIVDLCKALESGKDIRDVGGLIVKDGHWAATPKRKDIADLDSLAWPDYEGFDLDSYFQTAASFGGLHMRNTVFMLSSRSCPYLCTFCFHTTGRKYRVRGLDDFFAELDHPFTMPAVGLGKQVWLRLGGILPAGEVYLNGVRVGYTKSSRTQQRVDVTRLLKVAAENLIAIKVCDWPKVKLEGLWEMTELQRVWTGVYRSVRLEVTDEVSVLEAYVQPDLAASSVRVSVQLTAPAPAGLAARFTVRDGDHALGTAHLRIPRGATTASGAVKLGRFTAWSPNHPQLYLCDISLRRGRWRAALDKVGVRFGMREIATRGAKFHLNGQPIYLRCFGDDQLYLQTLSPPGDLGWYLPRLKRARQYGLNAAKSCEEIFSQDYLEAADEVGRHR